MDNVNASIIDAYLDELDRQTAALEASLTSYEQWKQWTHFYWRGMVTYQEWLDFDAVWPDAIEVEMEVYT